MWWNRRGRHSVGKHREGTTPKNSGVLPQGITPEALAALERANISLGRAQRELEETSSLNARAKDHRVINHFGPIIFEGMTQGRRSTTDD